MGNRQLADVPILARMHLLNEALRAQAPRRPSRHGGRSLLLVGAAGALGAEVLHQLLASRRFASVGVLVDRPIGSAAAGMVPVAASSPVDQLAGYDTVVVVFNRDRHANGREQAFSRPSVAELPALADRLAAAGVCRLMVVTPHAPGSLPAALRRGLADLDEQAITALGFEHLVFMRPMQSTSSQRVGSGMGDRLAAWMLSQLAMMIPQQDQSVSLARVAALAVQIAGHLAEAPPGTRVVPPELVWQAARSRDVGALAHDWLAGHAVDIPSPGPMRL